MAPLEWNPTGIVLPLDFQDPPAISDYNAPTPEDWAIAHIYTRKLRVAYSDKWATEEQLAVGLQFENQIAADLTPNIITVDRLPAVQNQNQPDQQFIQQIVQQIGQFADQFKQSVNDLTAELRNVETRLNTRIDNVETRLSTRIDNVETQLNARINGLNTRIDGLNTRIGGVETRLNARIENAEARLNTRIDNVAQQLQESLTAMDGRLTTMDGRLNTMNGRLIDMDGRLIDMDDSLTELRNQLQALGQRLTGIERQLASARGRMANVTKQLEKIRQDLSSLKGRVTRGLRDAGTRMVQFETLLTDETRRIEARMIRVERCLRRSQNGRLMHGRTVRYEEVPASDGTVPSEWMFEDEPFPVLHSLADCDGLSDEQVTFALERYEVHPISDTVAGRRDQLLDALGVVV